MPAFEFINDERFPSHGKAASELKDRIASGVHESFGEINKRMYRRYEKYTGKTLDLHQEVLIQSRPCASQPDPNSFGFMTRYPEVTFFEGLSEAPDEVASGDWLSLLCAAGLQFSIAHARFLADLPSGVLRTRWEMNGKVVFAIRRQRLPS